MITVVIPTYNEEKNILSVLKNVRSLTGRKEIIVVDGGSDDGTAGIAREYCDVVSSVKGRGSQMNAGAKKAKGDILLFLHADCRLKQGALEAVESAISEGYVGGCFTLYSGESVGCRLIDFLGQINSHIFREYFGDHGIFVRKDVFDAVGCFNEMPVMEDVEFSRRLRYSGEVIQLMERIHASTRRFDRGLISTLTNMLMLRVLYALGARPERLSRCYPDIREVGF